MRQDLSNRQQIYKLLNVPELRSHFPRERVAIRVYNLAAKPIDVFWLDYSGNPIAYGQIEVKGCLNIRTFVGHPWIFRQSGNGVTAFWYPGRQEVFHPQRPAGANPSLAPVSIGVYLKADSLYDLGISRVGDLFKRSEIETLPLPTVLKEDLNLYATRKLLYQELLCPHLREHDAADTAEDAPLEPSDRR